MPEELIPTEGLSRKWISQFFDSFALSKTARELAINKALRAGLKDKAKQLIAFNQYLIAHPEIEALRMMREDYPDTFDKEHPEYKDLALFDPEQNPDIMKLYMEGNKVKIANFENHSKAWTRWVSQVQDLKDETKYSSGSWGRYKPSLLKADGTPPSAKEFLRNEREFVTNKDKVTSHGKSVDTAKFKYQKYLDKHPGFLDEMNSEDYNTPIGKEMIDTNISRRAGLLDKIQEDSSYLIEGSPWTADLDAHIKKMGNIFNQSWNNPKVLDSDELKGTISRAGTTIPQQQESISRNITSLARPTRKGDGTFDWSNINRIGDAFKKNLMDENPNLTSNQLEALWQIHRPTVLGQWESAKVDQRGIQNDFGIFAMDPSDPDVAQKQEEVLRKHVGNIRKAHISKLGEVDVDQSAANEEAATAPNTEDIREPINVFANPQRTEPPQEVDPILEILASRNIFVTPTGVFKWEKVPGTNKKIAKEIELENDINPQTGVIINEGYESIFTRILGPMNVKGGMDYVQEALSTTKDMRYGGVTNKQWFERCPTALQHAVNGVREKIKELSSQEGITSQQIEEEMNNHYKMWVGEDVSDMKKIGDIVRSDLNKKIPVNTTYQNIQKATGIRAPPPHVRPAPPQDPKQNPRVLKAEGDVAEIKVEREKEALKGDEIENQLKPAESAVALETKKALARNKIVTDNAATVGNIQKNAEQLELEKVESLRNAKLQEAESLRTAQFNEKKLTANEARLNAEAAANRVQAPVEDPNAAYSQSTDAIAAFMQKENPNIRNLSLKHDPVRKIHTMHGSSEGSDTVYPMTDIDRDTAVRSGMHPDQFDKFNEGPPVAQPQTPPVPQSKTIIPQSKPTTPQQPPRVEPHE